MSDNENAEQNVRIGALDLVFDKPRKSAVVFLKLANAVETAARAEDMPAVVEAAGKLKAYLINQLIELEDLIGSASRSVEKVLSDEQTYRYL